MSQIKLPKEKKAACRAKFDGLLTVLADSIGTDDKFESRGNAAADRIFRLLQRESRYSLDRFRVAGGKAKKTSIRGHVDYDCVVYVNGERPPFGDVIAEFRRLLVRHLGITNVEVTPYSLQFQVDGVSFDLLPAANEVATHKTSDTAREQVRKTLQIIKTVPADKTRYHSAALTEGAVGFVQSRSLFAHRLMRLCKLWRLGVKASLSGASTMVETVAAKAAEKQERKAAPSLRAALTYFFQLMQSKMISVVFDYNYGKKDIPSHIAQERQLVLDPTNPKNNLLKNGLPVAFSERAVESMTVLGRLSIEAFERELSLSDIKTIF